MTGPTLQYFNDCNDTIPGYTYTPPSIPTPSPSSTKSANISIREYIYFLPHPLPPGTPIPYTPGLPLNNPLNLPVHPFEPTHTLVLTTPNRTFIDLRYLKPHHPSSPTPFPNTGSTRRLEWGFAGHSTSTPTNNPDISHSVWTHTLDSRFPFPPGSTPIPVDEGDMYILSPSLTLEHGVAFHPHLGRVAGHEELWRDLDVRSTNATGRKVCVVLRCEDKERGLGGVVIRVGQFCQGLVICGDGVATERWEFDLEFYGEGEEDTVLGEEKGWKRMARTGDWFLPCAVTFRPEVLGCGGRVRCGGVEWVVEELCQ